MSRQCVVTIFDHFYLILKTKSCDMIKSSKITALLLFGSIYACSSSPESALRKNTETFLMESLNDASSYEFVAIDDLKALTVADTLILHLDHTLMPLKKSMYNLLEAHSERLLFHLRECAYYSECNDSLLTEARNAYLADSIAYSDISTRTEKLLERSDFPDSKQTEVGYKAVFKYRANNSNGAKELREMMIYTDLNYNLLDRYIRINP